MTDGRAAARRGLVLPRRRLRRARAVAGATARAAGGRPRRQAHQGVARARAGARSGACTMPSSASACTATTPTSRRRCCACCAGCCCCPAAIAWTGCGRSNAPRTQGVLVRGEAQLPDPPDLSLVREEVAARRSRSSAACRPRYPQQPAVPADRSGDPRRLLPRSAGQPQRVGAAADPGRVGRGASRRPRGGGGAAQHREAADRVEATERAAATLDRVISDAPASPAGALARARALRRTLN